ncbi:MAG: hypothetical protein GX595_13390 [Lentisphaerae bacterium]|nr:hypothetical protein [Lentisphaerota bacterium]
MRTQRHRDRRRHESGYVTVFILGVAVAVFMVIAGTLQTHRALRAWNQRHAGQLQARAAAIAIAP